MNASTSRQQPARTRARSAFSAIWRTVLLLLLLIVSNNGLATADVVNNLPFPLEPGDVFANAPLGVTKLRSNAPRTIYSKPVGVQVLSPPPAAKRIDLRSGPLSVFRGPGVLRVQPDVLEIGQTAQALTIVGYGLNTATSRDFLPSTGITIQSWAPASDGSSAALVVNVAANAAAGTRRLILRNAAGKTIPDLVPQASAVLLRANAPRVDSITPVLLRTNNTYNIVVRGINLRGIPANTTTSFQTEPTIRLLPADDLTVGSDVSANITGTEVTFTLSVAAGAALVPRLLQVETASGISSAVATPNNTLQLTNNTLSTYVLPAYRPITVRRDSSNIKTSLLASQHIGVARGPTITRLEPGFLSPGTSGQLIVHGNQLQATTALQFQANTGLTITPGSLQVSSTQVQVHVTVAADAPRTMRQVSLIRPAGRIDSPQLLEIRDAPPTITALNPNFVVRDGTAQTIQIQGQRLAPTTVAEVLPGSGLIIENYTVLSNTTATLRLRATALSPLGPRLVKVSSSNTASSDTRDSSNTLYIADRAQVREPLVGPYLGVMRQSVANNIPRTIYAAPISVVRGPYANSITPSLLSRGGNTRVTIAGRGLSAVTAVEIVPTDGLSISDLQIAPDGNSLSVQVNVAADATSNQRLVRLRTSAQDIAFTPLSTGFLTISNNQVNAPTANPDTYSVNANATLSIGVAEGVLGNDTNPAGGAMFAVLRTIPANGVVSLASNGSFVYSPRADYVGTDSFTYSAGSGAIVGAATTVTIQVTEPNDARDDTYGARDNEVLVIAPEIGLLANDRITTAGAVIELQSQPTLGIVAVAPNGGFEYRPNGSAGTDRFRYRLVDGALRSLPAEVSINIQAINEQPIAEDDFYAVDRGRVLTISAPGVLSNDRDPDRDTLTLRLLSDPAVGTLSLASSGGFTYTPPANYVGQTSFRYEITDPAGLRAEAVAHITVNDNLAPQPDSYTMNEGEVLFVDAPGLLANDSIIARGNLRILLSQQPTFGTVQIANDGSFVYRPDTTDRSGVIVFRYTLQDDVITSSPVDVRITINPINDPPQVSNDLYLSDENAELSIPAPGVMANDRDDDSSSISATLLLAPTNGTISLRADGSFTYIPAINYRGVDSFEYRAVDNQGAATTGTVRIEVTQPPTATNDVYLVDVDTLLTIADPDQGLLINDHDAPEDDSLTAVLSETTDYGSLILNANGTFSYQPNPGFSGIDTFSYQVTDSRSLSNIGTVTLAVGITSLPRANPDEYELQEEQELIVPAAEGLLANDTDADTPRAQLEAFLVGTDWVNYVPLDVTVNRDGSFRVRAPRNFSGETFFTYQIYDGTDISNTAVVTLNIVAVNDGVDAIDDQYSVKRNTVFESNQRLPRYNDVFDEDFQLRYEIVDPPQFGSAEMNAQTSLLRYTPAPEFAGSDTLTYRATQIATGISDTAVIRLRVNAAPISLPDAYTVPEDALSTLTPTMIANDSDPDGDPLSYFATSFSDNGYLAVTVNAVSNPTLTRVQTSNHFYGLRTLRYVITDGTELTDGTITFTVTPVPDNPIATGENYLTDRDTELVISSPQQALLYNDFDPDMRPYPTGPNWPAAAGQDLLPLGIELIESTRNGALNLSPVGTFSYRPNTGYSGVDSFRYRVVDATGRTSNTVTATIRVNSPPVAFADNYVGTEDVALSVSAANGVLVNDLDTDGDQLTAIFVNNDCHPCHGRVQLRGDGSFVYTPDPNFAGQDEFYYRVRDGFTVASTGRVSITVLPVNDAPVTEPDTYRTREDEVLVAPAAQGTLRNDREVDGDVLVNAEAITNPNKGTIVFGVDGRFTYTPNADQNGRDTFRYRVYDTTGLYTDEEVEVLLTPVNDAPLASNDSYQTEQEQTLQVPAGSGLLQNDRDVDGPALVAALIGPPTRGRVTVNPDGSFRYVPDAGFAGTDVFQYQVDDGLGALAVANAIIVVRPIASPIDITTEDDFYQFEGPSLTVPARGVLSNDRVTGADALTATLVLPPDQGTLNLNADGSFEFQAPPGFVGTLGFTYAAQAGADSALAYVVLDVLRTDNVPPTALPERFAMFEDGILDSHSSGGVLVNDSDYENATLTAELIDIPEHGLLNFNANGEFTYRPDANFHGSDRLSYRAYDGQRYSAEVDVAIEVYAQNDAPSAMDDLYQADRDQSLQVIAAQGLLSNDSDVDGDPLQVELIDEPAFGQVIVDQSGSFQYLPLIGFAGVDHFRYAVTDGAARDLAEVSLNVRAPGNQAPQALGEALSMNEDSEQAIDLLANDQDPNGDALILVTITSPDHGQITQDGGRVSYRPDINYVGTDSIQYQVSDGALLSSVVTLTITVNPVNDPPLAATDLYQTLQAQALQVPATEGVLANDRDVDSALVGVTLHSAPSFGTAELANNGAFQYLPLPGFFGRDEFAYALSDGELTSYGRVIIDVTRAANQRPLAQGEVYVLAEDSQFDSRQSDSLLTNDFDADGQALSVQILAAPAQGTLEELPGGHVRYQPARNQVGDVVIPYAVSDGELQSTPVDLRLTFVGQPDAPEANPDAYQLPPDQVMLHVDGTAGVLANDSDPDGDALVAQVLGAPAHGVLKLNLDGSFDYTPNTPRVDRDQFRYEVVDALGFRSEAVVQINLGEAEPLPDPVFTNGFE